MSVWYRQSVDGATGEAVVIERHYPQQSDRQLLAAKASGAADKGWRVTWTGPRSFAAVKVRWGGALCLREFWRD